MKYELLRELSSFYSMILCFMPYALSFEFYFGLASQKISIFTSFKANPPLKSRSYRLLWTESLPKTFLPQSFHLEFQMPGNFTSYKC